MESIVLWFTGLSGSGKTAIATALCQRLKQAGKKVKVLDGDTIRNTLHKHLGFSPEDIKENNRMVAGLCLVHMGRFDFIIVSTISPFSESRKEAREIIGKNFIEVYIKATLEEVIRRDVKGLYKKALRGEIDNFIGVSPNVPYQEPRCPDVIIDTSRQGVNDSTAQLLGYLRGPERCRVA